LIESIANGDQLAMGLLFARHHALVYRFSLHLTGDDTTTEDIVSEVFLEVWRHSDRFAAKSKVSTWLLAIARHKAISAMRRRRPEVPLDDAAAMTIADPADDPEAATDHECRSSIVRKCLTRLPAAQRQVVDLVYYRDESVEEAAGHIGVPAGTVKTRLHYARNRMAYLLDKAGLSSAFA
jgi:RNA polymerase sigma-70 factor (ECF subfamily)